MDVFLEQRLNRFRRQHVSAASGSAGAQVHIRRPSRAKQSNAPCRPAPARSLAPEAKQNRACVGARGVAAEFSGVADDPPGAADKGTSTAWAFFGQLRTKPLNSQRALICLWCVC